MSDIESIRERKGLVKVPQEQADSKYRRVAKFLFLIGSKQAALVLKELDDVQVEKVIAELVTIRSVDKEEALEILNEFSQIYETHKNSFGGVGVAKEILQEAYGVDRANEILEKAVPPAPIQPFAYLRDIDVTELASVLKDELPSACAVVLSYLPPKQAAIYISALKDETRKKEIVLHLARMQKLNTDVLEAMSDALRKKIVALSLDKTSNLDGKSVLAKILRNSNIETEKNILRKLSVEDAELAQDIIKQIYTLDDILLISEKDLQYLLAYLTDTEIRYLIYNRKKEIRQRILTNISRNKALFILDDEKNLEPPRPKDYLALEKRFVNMMINEERSGNIIIPKDESEKLVY
ncbi:MAG: FliG C-terminal domain-containing protein [Treponemataceae bacterium]